MAIRTVVYDVSGSGSVAEALAWGGVQNEHNATEIIYKIDPAYLSALGEKLFFRIDFSSAGAGYDPSENLTLRDNTVSRLIPQKFTQYGGEMNTALVISRLSEQGEEEIIQSPAQVFFTVNKRKDSVIKNLSQFEEYMLKKVQEAKDCVELIREKLASGEFKGEKGEDYTLTQEDKNDIKNMVLLSFADVSEVGR